MDPMNASIVKQLSAIRDLYRAIREITARVMADFSIEALDAAIRQRSLLLLRIESERDVLDRLHGLNSWKGCAEYEEIRGHITAIATLDREAGARVSNRMNNIRRELVSLTDTSRAARLYTRNSAF
jgi:hypothetical protein